MAILERSIRRILPVLRLMCPVALRNPFSRLPHVQVSAIRWLLEHGADPNQVDKAGFSPLAWACRSSIFPAVQALIDAGADVMHRRAKLPGGR